MKNDEEIPFNSLGRSGIASNISEQDERDFSTLLQVKAFLDDAIAGLYKDFNAFNVPEDVSDTTAYRSLMRQIAGKKEAYDILVPLQNQIDSVIEEIKLKAKR